MLKDYAKRKGSKFALRGMKTLIIFIVSNIVALVGVGTIGIVLLGVVGWYSIQDQINQDHKPPSEIGELYKSSPLAPPYSVNAEFGLYDPFDDGNTKMHYGTDLSGGYGAKVMSVLDGVVVSVNMICAIGDYDCGGSYGNYVMVQHKWTDGTDIFTMYGHMDNSFVYVQEGEVIKQGQVIGLQGNSGLSSGTHVHFEVRTNMSSDYSYRKNPREYFEF